jgi:seryl-tRNA synthetase
VLDLRLLRDDPDAVRRSQTARGEDAGLVDRALAADEQRRTSIVAYEALRSEQKSLGKQVASAQGDAKQALLERTKELSLQVKNAEAVVRAAEEQLQTVQLQLSNVVEPEAPVGGEEDFAVIEHVGVPRDFVAEGFEPQDHVVLGK